MNRSIANVKNDDFVKNLENTVEKGYKMPDNMSLEDRSRTMSRIRSRWTRLEKTTHEALNSAMIQHAMHPKIPGNPDLIIPGQNLAVFLHGCFWHKCPRCFIPPKSNTEYWFTKLDRNVERDLANQDKLRAAGWKVLVIWEHEIKSLSKDGLIGILESKGVEVDTKKKLRKRSECSFQALVRVS